MSAPRTTRKHGANDGGGPGSAHQGGGHGHARRDGEDASTPPGAPTNPPESQVSGGGGERDSRHTHVASQRSSKHAPKDA